MALLCPNLNALISALTGAFSLNPSGGTGLEGQAAYNAFNTHYGAGSLVDPGEIEDDDPPRAFLNYILFDENFVLVDFGFDQVTDNAKQVGVSPNVAHDYLSLHVKVKQKGYLYVYVSNENPVLANVYFDDLTITHHTGVEQSDDYYAFGLTFNSYNRENGLTNQYLYNGKEKHDELDIGWMDYGARMYMPEIGRWSIIDPLSEEMRRSSVYSYACNNPIKFIDPDGMLTDYYTLAGQKIHVEDTKTDQKLVLTHKNLKEEDIKTEIQEGRVMDAPPDIVLDQMEEVFNSDLGDGTEFGFMVGKGGNVSSIYRGPRGGGGIGPELIQAAHKELYAIGDEGAYDAHLHSLHINEAGEITKYGDTKPSQGSGKDTDPKNFEAGYPTQSNVILGYRKDKVTDTSGQNSTTVGGSVNYKPTRMIGFYNKDGATGKAAEFEKFVKISRIINKAKKAQQDEEDEKR